jgi:hypothetical protein
MKSRIIFLVSFLYCSVANAQTNENLQIENLPTIDAFKISWDGATGNTYFIQQSQNLTDWNYVPIIESGDGTSIEYGFQSSTPKLFLRLVYTDQPTNDPENDDFDGDGVTNINEITVSNTDPFVPDSNFNCDNDSDGDGLSDSYEIENGLDPNDPSDASLDSDGDGISNFQEFLDGTDPQQDQTGGAGGGGGGGPTYSGFVTIPTNDISETAAGAAEGSREVVTSTYNATSGSTAYFLVVGIYSEEYPDYTNTGSEFNDVLDYTITPSVGSPITANVNVNSLDSKFASDGKSFDLGDGSNLYVFEEEEVIQNPTRGAFNATIEVESENVSDGSLPSGVTAAFFPVQIQPLSSDRNVVGDLILSNIGLSGGEKHFVSTKKNSSLNNDFITFEITGIPKAVFDEFLEWDGGQAPASGNTLQRQVKRDSSAHTELKVQTKNGSTLVDKINVWTVWATISGNVQTPNVRPLSNGFVQVGTVVNAPYSATATITPSSILTRSDRPNLTGANSSAPPGGNNADNKPLSGGANKKWDMSRRISRTISINAMPAIPNPSPLDVNIPKPSDPLIGNDDAGTGDENNTPGSPATIQSSDRPQRGFGRKGGDIGDTYDNDTSFEEFARLQINGNWYLISDPENWGVHFKFIKTATTEAMVGRDINGDGDQLDDITEAMVGFDGNGDGDTSDVLSFWYDNGSTSSN